LIETRSGQPNAIIRLEDVVGDVAALKKTPFAPEHFYWGFVHTIDHLKTLRIYTCEGKKTGRTPISRTVLSVLREKFGPHLKT